MGLVSLKNQLFIRKVCRAIPAVACYGSVLFLAFFSWYNLDVVFHVSNLFLLYIAFFYATITFYSMKGFRKIEEMSKKNFPALHKTLKSTNDTILDWKDIQHFVIVPNYKEDLEILRNTLNHIAVSSLAKEQITVVLAMEEREEEAPSKAQRLISEYSSSFNTIFASYHPPNLPGELAGKSSNESWAASKVMDHAKEINLDPTKVIITVCDADSLVTNYHFDYLTYKYTKDEERLCTIYQGPMVAIKNITTVPFLTRISAFAVSIHEVACLADSSDAHIPFSTYSMSLDLAQRVGGWDANVIAEDWHMFIKSFFATKHSVTVKSLYSPVTCYAVEGDGFISSCKERVVQAIRHSWGIEEVSYFFEKFILSLLQGNFNNLIYTAKIAWKICRIHYFNAVALLVQVWPSLLLFGLKQCNPEYYEEISITYSVVAFQYLSVLTIIPLLCSVICNKKLVDSTLKDIKIGVWSHFWWTIETIVFSVPVLLLISMFPTFNAATKQLYQTDFVYVVAKKTKQETV